MPEPREARAFTTIEEARKETEELYGSQLSSFVEHLKEAISNRAAGNYQQSHLEAMAACDAVKFLWLGQAFKPILGWFFPDH